MQVDRLNVQHQDPLKWRPTFNVARAHVDQAVRAGVIPRWLARALHKAIDRVEDRGHGWRGAAARAELRLLTRILPRRGTEDLRDALKAISRR